MVPQASLPAFQGVSGACISTTLLRCHCGAEGRCEPMANAKRSDGGRGWVHTGRHTWMRVQGRDRCYLLQVCADTWQDSVQVS
jgi:hypothetical protein